MRAQSLRVLSSRARAGPAERSESAARARRSPAEVAAPRRAPSSRAPAADDWLLLRDFHVSENRHSEPDFHGLCLESSHSAFGRDFPFRFAHRRRSLNLMLGLKPDAGSGRALRLLTTLQPLAPTEGHIQNGRTWARLCQTNQRRIRARGRWHNRLLPVLVIYLGSDEPLLIDACRRRSCNAWLPIGRSRWISQKPLRSVRSVCMLWRRRPTSLRCLLRPYDRL